MDREIPDILRAADPGPVGGERPLVVHGIPVETREEGVALQVPQAAQAVRGVFPFLGGGKGAEGRQTVVDGGLGDGGRMGYEYYLLAPLKASLQRP
jgi:hypothetical protein